MNAPFFPISAHFEPIRPMAAYGVGTVYGHTDLERPLSTLIGPSS
jgi:hypothetical protein